MNDFSPVTVQGKNVIHGQDADVYVEFYMRAVEDKAATAEKGRPIFRDVEYVRVMFPGDKSTQVDRKATTRDQERWPVHYQAFKDQGEAVTIGTPLEELTVTTSAVRAELFHLNIRTVEQLAAVNDSVIHQLGHGGRWLRDQAKEYMAASESNSGLSRLADENTKLREHSASLEKQVDALRNQVADLTAQFAQAQSQGPIAEPVTQAPAAPALSVVRDAPAKSALDSLVPEGYGEEPEVEEPAETETPKPAAKRRGRPPNKKAGE